MCFSAFTPFRLSTRHHYTRAPDYCAAQLAWLINHAVMHLQRPIANQTGRTLHKFKANAYRAVTEPPAFTAHELAYRQCEVVCCKWNVPRSQLGALTPHRASDDSIFDWAVNGLSMSSVNTYITYVCVCVKPLPNGTVKLRATFERGAKIYSYIKCAIACIILMSLINHFYVSAKSKDDQTAAAAK